LEQVAADIQFAKTVERAGTVVEQVVIGVCLDEVCVDPRDAPVTTATLRSVLTVNLLCPRG
jgi:hypothetical protein